MNDDFNKLVDEEEKEDEVVDDSGESSISGSAPDPSSDDDIEEDVADVIGNKPKAGVPFSLADEVEKDELDRRGLTRKDIEDEF